jgi:hypothetical protein
MKFLRERLNIDPYTNKAAFLRISLKHRWKIFIFLWCSACSSTSSSTKEQVTPTQTTKNAAASYSSFSIERLENEEFRAPSNSKIKLELGVKLWCQNARGPAVEKWLWILQFAPNSTEAEQASRIMREIEKDEGVSQETLSTFECAPQ